ncbi:MAG: hypothetical protein E7551_06855 [Ruminococcaceae bacterium]|nr:hypothetical protein [Oscillospiraceae bacterium]
MTKRLTGIISALLIMCLFVVPLSPVSAAEGVTPRYNNVATVTANMGISDSGKMTINYKYTGSSSVTTKAVITTYIEKKFLGLFWRRVDIGTTDDQWVDTIYDYMYVGTRNHQLSSSGTYRVTIIYKIYGSGGAADEIECQMTDSY